MGQYYYIKLKLKFRDEEKDELRTIKAMQKYIKEHDSKGVIFNLDEWNKEDNKLYSLEDMLRVFFAGWNCWDFEMKQGRKWLKVRNGFDASYGWESIMLDIFDVISSFLEDGSEIWIYSDDDYDHLVVKNGKCVTVH